MAPQQYFVCADLRAEDGTVYDLDFWVTSSDGGLAVTETTLHKVSGQPLYTGKAESSEEEHPEHPEESR